MSALSLHSTLHIISLDSSRDGGGGIAIIYHIKLRKDKHDFSVFLRGKADGCKVRLHILDLLAISYRWGGCGKKVKETRGMRHD